jgi:tripartite-type tricarboxylate transporter receptor subunit TctC
MKRVALALTSLIAIGIASSSSAQNTWPNRPVTIVVPFAVGGGTDIGTRILAQKLSQLWGQSVLIDNKGGAGGNVGLEVVARAKPDGYTLLTGNVGTQSINPTLYKKLNYNPDQSFVPLGQFAELPFVLAVTNTLPVKSVKDLVELAKAEPNKLTYASSGYGGSPHLSAETFRIATGTQLLHIPYKGGGAAMTDLISGTVHMIFVSVLETSAHIKAGKLKALAISSKARVAALPDVPTLQEAGYPGSESGSWLGLLAPTGTPKEIVDRISQSMQQALAAPEVQQQLFAQGALAKGGSPQDFAQLIANDRKRYASIIISNNITLD